jgi:hypothetical protein
VTTINDSAIQAELVSQVSSGALASPTTNRVYALYFPSGTTICDDSSGGTPLPCSNNAFCAYHGATTATVGGLHLLYIVQPYADSVWMNGCSDTNESGLSATERVTSHELAETITDPQVSLATSYGPPLGWYDSNYGEVADICEPYGSPAAPAVSSVHLGTEAAGLYTVSHVWSQAANRCVPAAPDAPAVTARAVSGGRVEVSWTAPKDNRAPITSYDIFESAPGSQPALAASGVDGSADGSGLNWISPAFADGTTTTFYVTAHNAVGQSAMSAGSTATADAVLPTVTLTGPTAQFTLGTSLQVTYSGSDTAGPVTYEVEYVVGNLAGGSWSTPRTLASNTSATSLNLPVTAGHEYCFKVSARDGVSNTSDWTAPRCTSVVADDRVFPAATGWSRIASSSAYRGTLTSSKAIGARLTTTVAGNRIALLVRKCATCGVIGVYRGSTLIAKISTASTTTRYRVLVLLPPTSGAAAPVTLRLLSKTVQIDGIAGWRTPPAF